MAKRVANTMFILKSGELNLPEDLIPEIFIKNYDFLNHYLKKSIPTPKNVTNFMQLIRNQFDNRKFKPHLKN